MVAQQYSATIKQKTAFLADVWTGDSFSHPMQQFCHAWWRVKHN